VALANFRYINALNNNNNSFSACGFVLVGLKKNNNNNNNNIPFVSFLGGSIIVD